MLVSCVRCVFVFLFACCASVCACVLLWCCVAVSLLAACCVVIALIVGRLCVDCVAMCCGCYVVVLLPCNAIVMELCSFDAVRACWLRVVVLRCCCFLWLCVAVLLCHRDDVCLRAFV